MVSPAYLAEDDEDTQITSGVCRLIGGVRIDGRQVKGFNGPSVRMRSTDTAVLLEVAIVRVRRGSGEMGESSSSASEGSLGWRKKAERKS